jgi:hypothetical protein
VLFGAHVLGAGMLFFSGRVGTRVCRWYFVAQAILFPLGILALPFFPFLALGFFTGRMDREGFVDIPFILATAHPVWVVTSLIIAFGLRGAGLELTRLWSALTQAARAGMSTFTKAMR